MNVHSYLPFVCVRLETGANVTTIVISNQHVCKQLILQAASCLTSLFLLLLKDAIVEEK